MNNLQIENIEHRLNWKYIKEYQVNDIKMWEFKYLGEYPLFEMTITIDEKHNISYTGPHPHIKSNAPFPITWLLELSIILNWESENVKHGLSKIEKLTKIANILDANYKYSDLSKSYELDIDIETHYFKNKNDGWYNINRLYIEPHNNLITREMAINIPKIMYKIYDNHVLGRVNILTTTFKNLQNKDNKIIINGKTLKTDDLNNKYITNGFTYDKYDHSIEKFIDDRKLENTKIVVTYDGQIRMIGKQFITLCRFIYDLDEYMGTKYRNLPKKFKDIIINTEFNIEIDNKSKMKYITHF